MDDYKFSTDIYLDAYQLEHLNKNKCNITSNINEPKKCLLCGKELYNKSFCPSHSIPRFILNNLQSSGRLLNGNAILNNDLLGKKEAGKNNTLIFKSICRECDKETFKDYENKDIYSTFNSKEDVPQKILFQIKLKNILFEKYTNDMLVAYLKNLSRIMNIKTENIPIDKMGQEILSCIRNELYYKKADRNMSNLELKTYKQDLDNLYIPEYNLGIFIKVNYNIGFAFQRDVCLLHDTKWNVINKMYDAKEQLNIKTVSIVVFPFESCSIIMLFTEKCINNYDELYNQLNNMTIEECIKWIVFYIFTTSQDVILSKEISEANIKRLKELMAHSSYARNPTESGNIDALKKIYDTDFYYFC